jgi:asparagine synthetase B (glutamine-hydrolysing)
MTGGGRHVWQPTITFRDRYWITYNAEIYNFVEL